MSEAEWELSVLALVDRMKTDDQHAFEVIYLRYFDMLYRHALRALGDDAKGKPQAADTARGKVPMRRTEGRNAP